MLDALDYIPGTSVLHRLNPVVKLAVAASIIITFLLTDNLLALLALTGLTLALARHAGAGRRLAGLLRMLAPIALAMLALQLVVASLNGTPLALALAPAARACLRLVGVALPLVLMLAVTRMGDLANACVENLHMPYKYAFTFTTALRFVPIFMQEMNAIVEAQTARGVEFDTPNPIKKLTLMLPVCVPLIVTSVAKTDAAALAAEQRGFYLRGRGSSLKRYPILGIDGAALACCAVLIALGCAL